ncbi:hypothetical protein OC25_07590 [Pedobacter kyungheensis]|uniref:Uncharacterized protein n=1 Tax=Pedobacter kyungheensis TaxID=1069985 RepID=A0A0C1G4W8_9SPHI|nr:hypothetical protein OC25_07590 [Pedobacter kyungheensis]
MSMFQSDFFLNPGKASRWLQHSLFWSLLLGLRFYITNISFNAQMKHIGVIITSASSRLLPPGIEYDAFIEKPFDIKLLEENVLRLATKN